ncbi:MAG: branched-chain amino acid ABC transporter permease, partial [Synergistales bacterium]|nr:branched-chain amino acid ABC transporter permease [Synergistales bacterium]
METLAQQLINGASLGSVYALIAVGYSLVYSILLFSNFAHGGFLVIGGYICYYALRSLGNNIWIAGGLSLLGAGLSAVLTERIAYKPIRERTNITLYLLIASLGMSIVIENIFVIVAGGRFRALPPVIPTDPVHLFGLTTTSAFDLLSLVVAVIFLAALQLFIVKSKWGLAIRAAAFDLKTAGL